MVFSSEAYERAFPRKSQEAVKVPEQPKQGNVLEEAEKIEAAKKIEEPKQAPAADPIEPKQAPAADSIELEGGVNNGD